MSGMTPDRNIIARASALGWKSKNLGDAIDSDAALDWFCRELESMSGWWDAALKQRDAAQDREKVLQVDRDAVITLRDHLRQEYERPAYEEVDGESRGPVEFAIDRMNEFKHEASEFAELSERADAEEAELKRRITLIKKAVSTNGYAIVEHSASDVEMMLVL